MTVEIDIDGEARAVTIERLSGEGHRFRVTLDGRVHLVDAEPLGNGRLSLILIEDGASHEIAVFTAGSAVLPGPQAGERMRGDAGDLTIRVDETTVQATVNGRRARRPASEDGARHAGAQRITAPMPGKVLRVLAKVGDQVRVRQGLIVIEAMKMENELGSPKSGRVAEIAVQEGMSVEAGRLLAIVE